MSTTVIGALITYVWQEEDPSKGRQALVSFEEITEEQWDDEDFDPSDYVTPLGGIPDDQIFGYTPSLEELKTKGIDEAIVLSIDQLLVHTVDIGNMYITYTPEEN